MVLRFRMTRWASVYWKIDCRLIEQRGDRNSLWDYTLNWYFLSLNNKVFILSGSRRVSSAHFICQRGRQWDIHLSGEHRASHQPGRSFFMSFIHV